jgi:hypothetical protein
MKSIAIIFKTHLWNDDISKFATKIYYQTKSTAINFFIILHDDDDNNSIYNTIESELSSITIKVTTNEIRNMYSTGFLSMHLSNHWILMWFNQKHDYDYVWSIEYDVRISGDTNLIWNTNQTEDFIYVSGNINVPNNPHNDTYIGKKLSLLNIYTGYLQLSRYSKNFLNYLDECFRNGENGQDELIIFSLARLGKFTMSNFLYQYVPNMWAWTWLIKYSDQNRYLFELSEKENLLKIVHPVKE